MTDLQRTTLHPVHERLGAKLVPFAGFEMPVQYDGIVAEHRRVRQAVGLFDVSHMGEVRVRGPEAVAAVNRLITNDLTRVPTHRAQYTCMCADDGTIIDDLISYRLADDDVLLCVNAANRAGDLAHIRARIQGAVEVVDQGDRWSQIAVQGPKAPALLARVLGPKAGRMKPFRVRRRAFGGGSLLHASTGYTGEAGGELYVPNALAVELWQALTREGEELGVGPAGLAARDTLRLEMGYCLYGNDIDRTTTPLEAGLGWVTRLDKEGGFIGRDALVAQQAAGLTRKLVGLELRDKAIPRAGMKVLDRGREVGAVTSGTKSPGSGRFIALAYVPISLAKPGVPLSVDHRGRAKAAVVAELPFHRR